MPFNLTRNEILITCGASYFGRGRSYQAAGRVESLEWDEIGQVLFAEVAGSGRNLYQQEIFFPPPTNHDRFVGDCSCPVSFNCKHVVAALLEWLELRNQITDPASETDAGHSSLQRWQEETVQRLQNEQASQDAAPGEPCLLYLLQLLGRESSQAISVQTFKSRRLKRGGWGKTSSYPLAQARQYHYYTPAEIAPLDVEIAQLLTQNVFTQTLPTLHGDTGVLVLKRLLQSGRCFFQSTENPPLRCGRNRTATFRWHKNDQDKTQLDINLDGIGHAWVPIPTTPPWYLDPVTHQCGIIDQPLPAALYHSLHKLPPVAAEQLRGLSYFLLEKLPPETIPLPIEIKIKCWEHPPVPTLILRSAIGPTGGRHHLARLRFTYGPISVPPLQSAENGSRLIRHQDEDWSITCHPRIEKDAYDTLVRHDLCPAPPLLCEQGEDDFYFATETLAASALAWRQLIDDIPVLENEGWKVEIDDSFQLTFETVSTLQADIDDGDIGWFEIGLNIEHNGQKFPLLPLLTQWLESNATEQSLMYHLGGNNWLEVPASVLEPVVTTLVELFQDPQLNNDGQLKLPRPQAHGLLDLEDMLAVGGQRLDWQGGKKLRQLAEKMRNFKGIELLDPPVGLNAELRNYQRQGLSWLQFLREYSFNGILADDMGLGKTIQALAHLQREKEAGRLDRPALIVAPTSVISNWQREAARFTPELKTLALHGLNRNVHFDRLDDYDLIITSYTLLNRDLKQHLKRDYHSLILDEAQAIKNPNAKAAQAACEIKASHRLCLTGTPLENHLGELWSLFHFLMPGFLGDQQQFNKLFRTPIEKHRDHERQQLLQKRLVPFILRRDKGEVVQELPSKTLIVREVELNGAQAKLYETLRIAMTVRIDKLLQTQGMNRSHIQILDALLKLRQVCCDPRLVKLESARSVKHSAKLELLMEMVTELLAEGRKILIFSQFTSMLRLIEDELNASAISYSKLTGRTRKRDAAIATFQNGDVPLFLISLKAGGVGLNLTAADTVIHYDPWWNPAVENQATDRAHRIGQEKPVFVYKLVASGTVEEKILQLQEKKGALARGVFQPRDQAEELPGMSAEDLLELLKPVGTTVSGEAD
ncbi:MAG: DEAD/DEAH box helicase [Desulfuromonadaceae bacterium]|nr:DEAD/DEAH box helicase [Desulfuromonadaceae bacterium]